MRAREWIAGAVMVAGLIGPAGAQQRGTVAPRAPSPTTMPGRGAAYSPLTDPWLNPFLNPYGPARPMGADDAFFYFLAAQQMGAQRSRVEQQEAAAARATERPLHQMTPGGSAADRYFGRMAPEVPGRPRGAPGRFNQHGRYFQGRAR